MQIVFEAYNKRSAYVHVAHVLCAVILAAGWWWFGCSYITAAAGISIRSLSAVWRQNGQREWLIIRVYVYTYITQLRGRKIIIAKEHITRGRGSKMFDTGTYANHKNNKTGAEVQCAYTTEKGRIFFLFHVPT